MKDFFRLPVFDVRILGAIVIGSLAVAHLAQPGAAKKLSRPRVARGERGVETTSLAISPVRHLIATSNTGGRVLLRATAGETRTERFLKFPGFATAVAFSPDGRSLAAVGFEPVLCIWDVMSQNAQPVSIVSLPIDQARYILFSPDGRSVAVATERDGTIIVWDLEKRRARLTLHSASPVIRMAFSPDGRSLATAGTRNDWSIILWDIYAGAQRLLLAKGPGPVSALAFSPDGTLLASASFSEHHVRLWDIASKRGWRSFAGQERSVNSLAFSPDGTLMATAANDNMIGLWDAATGRRLASLDSQALCLRTIAFSPDGRTLILATDDDDDVRFWELAELL